MICKKIITKLNLKGIETADLGSVLYFYDSGRGSGFHNPYGPSIVENQDSYYLVYFHMNNKLYTVTKQFFEDAGRTEEDVLVAVLRLGDMLPHRIKTIEEVNDLFEFPDITR